MKLKNKEMDEQVLAIVLEAESKLSTASSFLFTSRKMGAVGPTTVNLTIGAIQGVLESLKDLSAKLDGGAS